MGINYLALDDLFQISNGRKDIITYKIQVQMVEIYNEQVRDLLAEDSSANKYPLTFAALILKKHIFLPYLISICHGLKEVKSPCPIA